MQHPTPELYRSREHANRLTRIQSKVQAILTTMENTEEVACPRWHHQEEDSDRTYTQRPAQLIEVFDGQQHMPALLLSSKLSAGITSALYRGRDYRALDKTSAAELALIEDRLDDARCRLQCATDLLERVKRYAETRNHRVTEEDRQRLMTSYQRQH